MFNLERDNQFIFMQFTGLADRDGKEIYCSDVVSVVNNGEQGAGEFMNVVVVWHKSGWLPFLHISASMPVEVLGNIYENPELLK